MSGENWDQGAEELKPAKNITRRKAVKTIAGGVGALAAYHTLPVKWSKPVIEQIFLPAHAATSGITLNTPCTIDLVSGSQGTSIDVIRVSGFVNPPVGGLKVGMAALPNGGSGGLVKAFTTTASDGTYSTEISMTGGPGIKGIGVATAVQGAGSIATCTVGLPPAEKPEPPDPGGPDPQPDPAFIHELVSIEKGSTNNDILATFNPPTGGSLSGFYRIEFLNVNASATRAIQASVRDTTRSIQVNVPNDWSPSIAPSPGDVIRVNSFTTTPEYTAVDSSSSFVW